MRKLPVVPICRTPTVLRKIRINATSSAIPPRQEGRTRRHEREAGCDGRDCIVRRAMRIADGKVVWSWRPWAGAKRAGDDPRVTVTKRSWTPGRARSSVNTIARGRPDVSVEPVVTNSCAFYTAHEAAGAASTRLSLRPSLSPRDVGPASLGRESRRGKALCCLEIEPGSVVLATPSTVIARLAERSSTPRPIGSSADVSGILDRPPSAGDDSGGSGQ
jgi:hypothetical protein